MREYRLSAAADNDLIGIALYGDKHFGIAQSDRYREQLKRRFIAIADNPLHYPAVDHIRSGYRRSVCGAHSIYYRVEADIVLIVRILRSQDPHAAFA